MLFRSKSLQQLTALVCMSLASAGNAQVAMSVEDMEHACTQPTEAWVSFCNGYAQALVDAATLTGVACIPVGTTRTDIVVEIQNRTFAAIRSGNIPSDTPAFTLGLDVLKNRFPCDQEG